MLLRDLTEWDPDALDRLGDELGRCAGELDAVSDSVRLQAHFGGRWTGDAHDRAAEALEHRGAGIAAQADSFRRVGRYAQLVAPRLRALHAELAELRSRSGTLADDDPHLRDLLDRAALLDREASALLARETDLLAPIPGSEPESGDGPVLHAAAPRSLPALPMPPGAGTDPGEVARWWNGLDDLTRTALIAERPEYIGGLDGIPATARDLANRALLDTERHRLEAVATRLQAELDGTFLSGTVFDRLGAPGWFTDADAGLEQTRRKLAALDAIETTLAHGDRQLLTLDLSGREAMAAVAVGDVDTADHVAVFVPGAGSTVQGNLIGYDERVAALRDEAHLRLAEHGRTDESVAAVTWLNYQAPQWGWGLAFTERSPVSDLAARIAEPRLTGFLDGLAAARGDDPHVTTVGHSYGALVTGLALQNTGNVDAAVFMGAPGIGTGDPADLRIPPGAAHLVEAARDPVADTGTFGGDPSFLDGLVHLPSGPGTTAAGVPLAGVTGHSSYLDPGTSSAHHIAGVVAGIPMGCVR